MKNQQDIINKLEEIKNKGKNELYDIDFSYLSLEEADRKNFDEITKTILLNSEDYPDQIEFVKENANIEVIKELVHDENLRQNNIFPYVITQLLDNEKENKIGNVLNFIYKDNKPKTQTEINFVKNAINNYIDNKPYKVTAKDIISSVKYFDRATINLIEKADEKILTQVFTPKDTLPQSVADYVLSNSNYYAIKKLINKVGLETISKGFEYTINDEKKIHNPFDSHNDYIFTQFQKAVKSQKYNEKSYNEDIKIIGKLGKVEDFNNLVKEKDFYKNKKQEYLKNLNDNKPTKLSQLFNGIQEGITHENIKLTAYNKMLLQDVFAEYLKDNAQNIEIDDLKNQDVEKLLQYNVVDVNQKFKNNKTLIEWAVENNKTETEKYLLEKKSKSFYEICLAKDLYSLNGKLQQVILKEAIDNKKGDDIKEFINGRIILTEENLQSIKSNFTEHEKILKDYFYGFVFSYSLQDNLFQDNLKSHYVSLKCLKKIFGDEIEGLLFNDKVTIAYKIPIIKEFYNLDKNNYDIIGKIKELYNHEKITDKDKVKIFNSFKDFDCGDKNLEKNKLLLPQRISKTSLFADFSLALFFITAVVAAISLPIINHFVGVGIPFIATAASLGGFLTIETGAIIGAAGLKGIFAIKENNLLAKNDIKDKSLVKTFFSHYHLDSKVEKLLRERIEEKQSQNINHK
jgi:ankyrin repeat protein